MFLRNISIFSLDRVLEINTNLKNIHKMITLPIFLAYGTSAFDIYSLMFFDPLELLLESKLIENVSVESSLKNLHDIIFKI